MVGADRARTSSKKDSMNSAGAQQSRFATWCVRTQQATLASQTEHAKRYAMGVGVGRDRKLGANKLKDLASRMHYRPAMYCMAICYLNSYGVGRNKDAAKMLWLRLTNGYPQALASGKVISCAACWRLVLVTHAHRVPANSVTATTGALILEYSTSDSPAVSLLYERQPQFLCCIPLLSPIRTVRTRTPVTHTRVISNSM